VEKKKDIFTAIEQYFRKQSQAYLSIYAVMLTILIGIADYRTGSELSLAVFYILPISLVGWFATGTPTVLVCLVSSIVEFAANSAAGRTYSHFLIAFWNSAVLLLFFLLYAFILSKLKKEYGKRMKLIDELRDSLSELKRTKEELEQKSQDLARSNIDLQQFAYAASHDLKEPLRGVEGFTKLLARRYKGRLDENADEFIQFILEGVQRMQTLIKDLLAYSQIGTQGMHLQLMESESAVAQALSNLQTAIDEKGAVITHNALPKVTADPSQLSRLFQNLIGNAIKFHGDKAPEVHVSAERKGGNWLFSVHDNGIGIDRSSADRIFVIFQRLHTKKEYEGTGIGLAICKRIVERHGGSIWVESEPGTGSTFYFTIPERQKIA
jgi:signal transduction histidine kinase